jgi:hypothetical protein
LYGDTQNADTKIRWFENNPLPELHMKEWRSILEISALISLTTKQVRDNSSCISRNCMLTKIIQNALNGKNTATSSESWVLTTKLQ